MSDKNTVLITGGNKGLGFELAKKLASLNYEVFLTARNEKAGQDAVDKLAEMGLNCHFIQLDVDSPESIGYAFNEFKEIASKLDILVNNAGVMYNEGGILNIDINIFQKTLQTNTIGPLMMIQKFAPIIPKGGKIINYSSILGSIANMKNYKPSYSISKAALNAITKITAEALKRNGIAVNSVHPGWVKTDMGGKDAQLEISEGIETALWLITEASVEVTGKFFFKKQEIPW
jgi:NAD(P)-dependent dehydrogenase (short-subunit alcohol dehydrogenase family)